MRGLCEKGLGKCGCSVGVFREKRTIEQSLDKTILACRCAVPVSLIWVVPVFLFRFIFGLFKCTDSAVPVRVWAVWGQTFSRTFLHKRTFPCPRHYIRIDIYIYTRLRRRAAAARFRWSLAGGAVIAPQGIWRQIRI